MPLSFQFDPAQALVCCSASGVVTQDELKKHHRELTRDPRFTPETRILWQIPSAIRFDHSAAKFIEDAETLFAPFTNRRALVTDTKGEAWKTLQVWVIHREVRRDQAVKLFGTVEAARRWLDEPMPVEAAG